MILSQGGELCPGAVSSEESQTGVQASLLLAVEYWDMVSGQPGCCLDPHQQGGATPSGHGLPGIEHGLEHQGEGSLQLLTGLLHQLPEAELTLVLRGVIDMPARIRSPTTSLLYLLSPH